MDEEVIGFGVVGFGWMGRLHALAMRRMRFHYPDLPRQPTPIIAADPVQERLRDAVSTFGFREISPDWHDVVLHPNVDVVSITTPNSFHREIAVFAAEHGKHIWIEKPVGVGTRDVTLIAEAVARAGVHSTVGYNYRQVPAVNEIRRLIAEHQLGAITYARGYFLTDYASDPATALTWRFTRRDGGAGVIDDLLSHVVDLLSYLVGQPVVWANAKSRIVIAARPSPEKLSSHFARTTSTERLPVENPDMTMALIEFESGATGVVEASRVSVGRNCDLGFEIGGTSGAVSWNFERMNEFEVQSADCPGMRRIVAGPQHGEFHRFQPGPGIGMGYDDLKVIEGAELLRSMAGIQSNSADVASAASTSRILSMMDDN